MRFFFGRFLAFLAALLALIAASMPTAAGAAEDVEPAAAALDQYGKPLAAGVLARLSGARYPHPCLLYAWAYSPDGKTLVSLAEDQLVRFWNTADGRLVRQIDPPPVVIVPWPGRVSFSRDGSRLAVAYGSVCIRVIDMAEMKVLHDIRHLRPDIIRDGWQTVEFVGRGRLLLASSENSSYWIDPETGRVKDRKHFGRFEVRAAAANVTAFADGERVIEFCRCNAFNPDRISLYPNRLSYPHRHGPGQSGSVLPRGGQTLALSPDGEFIAAAGVELVRKGGVVAAQHPTAHISIYEISMNKLASSIEIPRQLIDHMTFSPDGRMLVASGPEGASAWDARTGERLTSLPASLNGLPYVFSPDGSKLSGVGGGTTIAEWDVASFAQAKPSDD